MQLPPAILKTASKQIGSYKREPTWPESPKLESAGNANEEDVMGRNLKVDASVVLTGFMSSDHASVVVFPIVGALSESAANCAGRGRLAVQSSSIINNGIKPLMFSISNLATDTKTKYGHLTHHVELEETAPW